MKEKEKQEHTPTDEKNPLYCESHEQICENLNSANKELPKYKVLQLSAEIFSILMIIGTVFMASNKLQLFGCYYCYIVICLQKSPIVLQFFFLLECLLFGLFVLFGNAIYTVVFVVKM